MSEHRLDKGKQELAMVSTCHATQLQHKRLARAATRERDEALHTLEIWMREFLQIARVALKDQPEALEQLRPAARRPKTGKETEELVRG